MESTIVGVPTPYVLQLLMLVGSTRQPNYTKNARLAVGSWHKQGSKRACRIPFSFFGQQDVLQILVTAEHNRNERHDLVTLQPLPRALHG